MQRDKKRICISISNEMNDKKQHMEIFQQKANFEEAILATGFGKFNIVLLFFLIPASFTQAYEFMAMSYVLPVAQCDLNITLEQKGLLSAVTFGGMITSGLIFGIISDIFGRRKLIVYGYLLNSFFAFLVAFSQNFMSLMILKFLCGFIFTGPFSSSTALLSEFHGSRHRNRVQLVRGVTFALGFCLLPFVAWIILPMKIDTQLFGFLRFRSWNLYLLVCAFGPLIGAVGFSILPESPKFLMSNGQNKEALRVFQKVFQWNTGKTDYPVKELKEEVTVNRNQTKILSVKKEIMKFLCNIKPLFKPPSIYRLILACSTAYILLLSQSILKLWLPQILQLTSDYKYFNNGTSFNVCSMFNILTNENSQPGATCQVNVDSSVYTNAMMISGPEILVFACSGFIIDFIGKTRLISILGIIASICAVCTYFAPNIFLLATFLAIYIPSLDLAGIIVVSISLEMFFTQYRTFALSFHFMAARLGALSANTIFASLIQIGCVTPFALCAVLSAAISCLMFLYPNTENKALQ